MNRRLRFGFVLTPPEKRALVQLSDVEGGLSQAATIRRLSRKEARRYGLWPAQEGKDEAKVEQVSD